MSGTQGLKFATTSHQHFGPVGKDMRDCASIHRLEKIVMRCAVNTYFSNKQKRDTNIPREDGLKVFKRSKIDVKYC